MSTQNLSTRTRMRLAIVALCVTLPFIVLFQVSAGLNGWESVACVIPIWIAVRAMLVAWIKA